MPSALAMALRLGEHGRRPLPRCIFTPYGTSTPHRVRKTPAKLNLGGRSLTARR